MLKKILPAILLSLLSFLATPLNAAPIEYHISTTPSEAALFAGARFDITYRFDHSSLSPTGTLNETRWPVTNTAASLRVTGTATLDGVYPASKFEDLNWEFAVRSNWSEIKFPTLSFDLGDFDLRTNASVTLPKAYFGNESTPLTPKPFQINEPLTWGPIGFVSTQFRFIGTDASGYAAIIPEPASAAICMSGALGMAFLLLTSRPHPRLQPRKRERG